MYHRFSNAATDERAISRDALLLQLQCLDNGYQVVSGNEHFDSMDEEGSLPPCSVVLTVDDGYADFADNAYALFRKFEFPVTVFVATGFVSGEYWFWWDKLRYCIDSTKLAPHKIFVTRGPYGRSLAFVFDSSTLWSDIADDLLLCTQNEIKDAILEIFKQLDVELPIVAPNKYAPLSWGQIRDLESANICFASQTRNHISLAKFEASNCRNEVLASLETLAIEAKHSPPLFCYPHGTIDDYTVSIERMLCDLDFAGAYAAHQKPDDRSRYSFPRYGVSNDMVDFEWKMCGAERIGLWIRTRLSTSHSASRLVLVSVDKDPG